MHAKHTKTVAGLLRDINVSIFLSKNQKTINLISARYKYIILGSENMKIQNYCPGLVLVCTKPGLILVGPPVVLAW
jgi:hypothetical protein